MRVATRHVFQGWDDPASKNMNSLRVKGSKIKVMTNTLTASIESLEAEDQSLQILQDIQ